MRYVESSFFSRFSSTSSWHSCIFVVPRSIFCFLVCHQLWGDLSHFSELTFYLGCDCSVGFSGLMSDILFSCSDWCLIF